MKQTFITILALWTIGAGIYFGLKHEYIVGCSETMRGLYQKLGLKKVDENSLKDFCTDQWGGP